MDELCRKYGVRSLRLFGSAVREDFNSNSSDLDFLVIFDRPADASGAATQFFGLLDDLESLFGRKVDLLEELAIENPYLKSNVLQEARTLYAA